MKDLKKRMCKFLVEHLKYFANHSYRFVSCVLHVDCSIAAFGVQPFVTLLCHCSFGLERAKLSKLRAQVSQGFAATIE
jgi:hypothetical protein